MSHKCADACIATACDVLLRLAMIAMHSSILPGDEVKEVQN